jgi:PAS domain-containing protein
VNRQLTELNTAAETAANRLLDVLPAAMYTTDALGRITYFNEAAAALWGCRPELGGA